MEKYRIEKGIDIYYITFSVVEWLPVFVDESACEIVTDRFSFCSQHKHLGVNAFVIMPTHLHAIVFDVQFDGERLKRTLDDMSPSGVYRPAPGGPCSQVSSEMLHGGTPPACRGRP